MLKRLLSLGLLAGCVPLAAVAAERPVVVELFTSEGCSSCPPADAFLTDLARGGATSCLSRFTSPIGNSLGWRDPYSLDAATSRQSQYGSRFGDGSYTPEMVVDGQKGLVGSERGEAEAAIASAERQDRTAAPVHLSRQGGRVEITVGAGSGSGRILLVGFDPEHRTARRSRREQRANADRIQHRPLDPFRRAMDRRGPHPRRGGTRRRGGRGSDGSAGRRDHRGFALITPA